MCHVAITMGAVYALLAIGAILGVYLAALCQAAKAGDHE